ncbi:hypothetical protein N657DRAFT_297307 [Parathielavia appendiculata]|uniref:Uncharacterized protein n=1 Tax=Parathielavia appendiculata TaxID=2587402 RepID=A0AAN6Z5Q3_9PEZI|nr:hypothetical protein N657DRAFT_297307 [Parathielavia appendiculata]
MMRLLSAAGGPKWSLNNFLGDPIMRPCNVRFDANAGADARIAHRAVFNDLKHAFRHSGFPPRTPHPTPLVQSAHLDQDNRCTTSDEPVLNPALTNSLGQRSCGLPCAVIPPCPLRTTLLPHHVLRNGEGRVTRSLVNVGPRVWPFLLVFVMRLLQGLGLHAAVPFRLHHFPPRQPSRRLCQTLNSPPALSHWRAFHSSLLVFWASFTFSSCIYLSPSL